MSNHIRSGLEADLASPAPIMLTVAGCCGAKIPFTTGRANPMRYEVVLP
jgi:hypothetical protein